MNPDTTPISDEELILLADCELSGSTREELIQRIDAANDWKRCALYFLQTQALRTTFGAIQTDLQHGTTARSLNKSDPDPEKQETLPSKLDNLQKQAEISPADEVQISQANGAAKPINLATTQPETDSARSSWPVLTIVASVLVLMSFTGGVLLGGKFLGSESPDSGEIARQDQAAASRREADNRSSFKQPDSRILSQIHAAVDSIGVQDSEIVALVNVEHDSSQQVFPLIRSRELSQQIQQTSHPEIPSQIADQMRRSGWKVQSSKHFVSVNLPNGKSKTFPIGMLNYKFIGNPVF